MTYSPQQLANLWRTHAAILRSRAAVLQATILDQCADELEAACKEMAEARVSLDEAVRLTGFTRGHLHRLVKSKKLINVGTDEDPEFMLSNLPKKPGYDWGKEDLARGNTARADYAWQAARAVLFEE